MSGRPQITALVLVDLQNDFLERPGLIPDRVQLCARAATLLAAARRHDLAVVHAQTVTRADGSDRMPHWKQRDVWQCVEGTAGVLPPASLVPVDGELVLRKQFFSAFGDSGLDPWLRAREVTRLLVAGVYLHSCVRATVLDAYERGYSVCLVDDAVGTTEPLHAELTRAYLRDRCADVTTVDDVIADLERGRSSAGRPMPRRFVHRNPCRTAEVIAEIAMAGAADVVAAVETADAARTVWAGTDPMRRAEVLERWAGELEAQRDHFTDLMIHEVGKPRRFAEEEAGRAVAHVRIAAELIRDPARWTTPVATGVRAMRRPHGTVGLVTPWNNPLAIPIGKIAPALAFGNAVILKPALQASATTAAILASIERAGCPAGIVSVVSGDAEVVRALCREPRINAVSVTGSLATGRTVAAYCAESMKPLQAELGGNNAAIVLRDADLEEVVAGLVRAAFGFAGQRCTAIRRFIVEEPIAPRFAALARDAVAALANGDPNDRATDVGPLISADKRDQVMSIIEDAVTDGARVLCGGRIPANLTHGAWMEPTLLTDIDRASRVAQEETFGPLAVLLVARDLDDALAIANGVPQGLVLSAHTHDVAARARIREAAEAGIIQLATGPLAVHPRAPFSGWKASGLGPPEHGVWDADFYARVQAVYADEPC